MQAVILAGGLATRLRPLTETTPKSMILFNDKPFLQYQLEFLRKNSVDNIVLCVGYLHEQIEDHFQKGEKFGVSIKYSREGKDLLGTAGALKKAEDLLEDKFFLLYGDSYVRVCLNEIYSYFANSDELALMVIYKNEDRYDKSNVCLRGNKVCNYDKNAKTNEMIYIDYGISLLKKDILEFIPEGVFYSLDHLFNDILKKDSLLAFEAKKRFYEIGSFNGIEDFNNFILTNSASEGENIDNF